MRGTIERVNLRPDDMSVLKELPEFRASSTGHLRPPERTHRRVHTARASRRSGVVLLGLWVVTIFTIVITEPTPSQPNASVPAWTLLLGSVALLLMPLVLVGLLARARWGFAASLAAAGALFLVAVECFATEHHAGLFPYGEAAAFAFLGSLSWRGLRRA